MPGKKNAASLEHRQYVSGQNPALELDEGG